MKKGYLAISYSNRKKFDKEVNNLLSLFSENKMKLLVFVDKYNFQSNQEKEMMKVAFKEIDSSDFLIAELTTKSIGVGIEIGYAFTKKIPIFYLRKRASEYSTTAAGCSKYIIEYDDEIDLVEKMKQKLFSEISIVNI